MKRLSIAIVIIAVFAFIAYKFLFADRRLRLKVDYSKQSSAIPASFNYSGQKLSKISVIPRERMLVYNGSMEFEVDSARRARDIIKKIVREHDGYIVSERQDDYGHKVTFSQSIRVPSSAMDDLVRKIEGLAGAIKAKKMSAIDVTEEFIDIESRVLTKKKAEVRYQEIIKDAKTIEDIVKIEDKISIVRGEIESMEGRLKYLENQVTFSTLDLEFYERGTGATAGFASELVDSLKNGWQGLLTFVTSVVNVWPIILIVAFVFWIFRRRIKRLTFS